MSVTEILALVDAITWGIYYLTGLVWCVIVLYEVRAWLKRRVRK